MTARQPRRRRRVVAAAPLPRPTAADAEHEGDVPAGTEALASSSRRAAPRRPQMREHHVTTDYGYVHKDLIGIGVIGAVTVGFIVAMSFIVG